MMNASTASALSQAATRFEILNPADHAHLRVRRRQHDDPHFVQIVGSEFAAAAACCPVLLTKDSTTGAFFAGAMLGFKPGECLLNGVDARGGFDPLNLQRDGFFVAGQQIAIDRNNPRFSETEGEPLFEEGGQPSAHLRHIQRQLGQLQDGIEKTAAFIRALAELKLIESIDVSLNFDSGERLTLQGLYTISLDALHALDDTQAVSLFRRGDLQRIYVMNASLHRIAILGGLRNRWLARSA